MPTSNSGEPHAEVAAWIDRVLERHPQHDSDAVLDLRGQSVAEQDEGSRITERHEAARILTGLRKSFFDIEPGTIEKELARLELSRLPDLRASADRLTLDEQLRSTYAAMSDDRKVDAEMRRLLVNNVVLPWRERRRELADFLTARQVGTKSSPNLRNKARSGVKRVAKHYSELEGLHAWWLQDVVRLPRWNPFGGILRLIRGWALNYVALISMMMMFLLLFAGGALGHRFFLTLFGRLFEGPGSGAS